MPKTRSWENLSGEVFGVLLLVLKLLVDLHWGQFLTFCGFLLQKCLHLQGGSLQISCSFPTWFCTLLLLALSGLTQLLRLQQGRPGDSS